MSGVQKQLYLSSVANWQQQQALREGVFVITHPSLTGC
ncbi:hypothetical protein S35_1428 [Escherichia coli B104]|nr:hypothetical protein S35_1428 [Escherichia coli B104]